MCPRSRGTAWPEAAPAALPDLSAEELERRLPSSTDDLADLHPGAWPEDATTFYEDTAGTGHLLELAAWHLSSADYIADIPGCRE